MDPVKSGTKAIAAALIAGLTGGFATKARAADQPSQGALAQSEAMGELPSRNLTRLHYYPHPGRLYLAPDIEYIPTDLASPESDGGPGNASTSHSFEADLNAIYGLPIDGLRIGASESWLIHRFTDSTNAKSGFVNQTDSSGFSDPTVELQYRFMDSQPWGFAGDVNLSVSPSWVTHTIATSTAQGSDGKGYGTTELSANLYWIMPLDDVGLYGGVTRQFSGNGVNPTTPASSTSRSSAWAWTMTAVDRFHLTPQLYAQLSAVFSFSYAYSQTNQATTPVITQYQVPFHVNPTALVGYLVLPNFTLDAAYTYQNDTTTSTPGGGASTMSHTIENTVVLRGRVEI